jgi:hypothetical protein
MIVGKSLSSQNKKLVDTSQIHTTRVPPTQAKTPVSNILRISQSWQQQRRPIQGNVSIFGCETDTMLENGKVFLKLSGQAI